MQCSNIWLLNENRGIKTCEVCQKVRCLKQSRIWLWLVFTEIKLIRYTKCRQPRNASLITSLKGNIKPATPFPLLIKGLSMMFTSSLCSLLTFPINTSISYLSDKGSRVSLKVYPLTTCHSTGPILDSKLKECRAEKVENEEEEEDEEEDEEEEEEEEEDEEEDEEEEEEKRSTIKSGAFKDIVAEEIN
ncbi:hypothetical protein V1477_005319 [Vespula maculifrons]|uniref:Uncharacterized protein n=1 Tax=Vespula maculifrons TaxID=7453 RepID=A0ABD2CPB3_VESMC